MGRRKNDITLQTVREVSTVGENPTFLRSWAKRNEPKFEAAMEALFDENPYKYAELYLRVLKEAREVVATPKINATINQNNTQINKLDAASEIQDKSWRNSAEFSQYEEIK